MAVVVRDSNGKELKRVVQWGPASIDVLTITAVGAYDEGDTVVMVTTEGGGERRMTAIDMGSEVQAWKVHHRASSYLESNLASRAEGEGGG